jgi:hypothetical protein
VDEQPSDRLMRNPIKLRYAGDGRGELLDNSRAWRRTSN